MTMNANLIYHTSNIRQDNELTVNGAIAIAWFEEMKWYFYSVINYTRGFANATYYIYCNWSPGSSQQLEIKPL